MKKSILLFLFLLACKPPQLSTNMNDRDAFLIYKNAYESEEYKVFPNNDSTFALCILNDGSERVSEPVSFFIINLSKKEKTTVSINEYHKVRWIDNENLIFSFYSGTPKNNRNSIDDGKKEYIFNVLTKRLIATKTPYDK
jgi:hypothetical protein